MLQEIEKQLYTDYSKTLSPEEYERYLVFRKQREHGKVQINRSKDWCGVDPEPIRSANLRVILEKLREYEVKVDNKLRKQHTKKGTKIMTETDTYTSVQLTEKLGIPIQTLGAWLRYGHIPQNAVISKGIYKKPVIDTLITEGSLPPPKRTGNIRKGKNPATSKSTIKAKNRTQNPPIDREPDPESYAEEFWLSHRDLAVRILIMPETTRNIILKCVDEVLRYWE
jgi:hypothetical protein